MIIENGLLGGAVESGASFVMPRQRTRTVGLEAFSILVDLNDSGILNSESNNEGY